VSITQVSYLGSRLKQLHNNHLSSRRNFTLTNGACLTDENYNIISFEVCINSSTRTLTCLTETHDYRLKKRAVISTSNSQRRPLSTQSLGPIDGSFVKEKINLPVVFNKSRLFLPQTRHKQNRQRQSCQQIQATAYLLTRNWNGR
jgi:hypothetical protein